MVPNKSSSHFRNLAGAILNKHAVTQKLSSIQATSEIKNADRFTESVWNQFPWWYIAVTVWELQFDMIHLSFGGKQIAVALYQPDQGSALAIGAAWVPVIYSVNRWDSLWDYKVITQAVFEMP